MLQEFVQAIKDSIKSELADVHTAMPGKIVSFDIATGLATVLPAMKFKKPDGSTMAFPQITGVPVVFPQANGMSATIAFPIKAGDGCLIITAEESIDYWLYGHETDTSLQFDITNAICIPGLFNKANEAMAEACNNNAIVIKNGSSKIQIKSDEITLKSSKVTIEGDLDVKGTVKSDGDVEGNGVSLENHTHSGDGEPPNK